MEYCSYCGKSIPPEIDRECWVQDGVHYETVYGNSGQYLVGIDIHTGQVVHDDRPWQMRESMS